MVWFLAARVSPILLPGLRVPDYADKSQSQWLGNTRSCHVERLAEKVGLGGGGVKCLEKIRVEIMENPEFKRDEHNDAFSPEFESWLLVTTDLSPNYALDSGYRWGILLLATDARCDSGESLAGTVRML